jgi:hypothetical protein
MRTKHSSPAARVPGIAWPAGWVAACAIAEAIGMTAAAAAARAADALDPGTTAAAAAGALALGAGMGALLGLAQACAFVGTAAQRRRWVLASTLAWPPAMVVIFAGATLPDATWPAAAVVPLGTLTGAAAGAFLGAVLGATVGRAAKVPPRQMREGSNGPTIRQIGAGSP